MSPLSSRVQQQESHHTMVTVWLHSFSSPPLPGERFYSKPEGSGKCTEICTASPHLVTEEGHEGKVLRNDHFFCQAASSHPRAAVFKAWWSTSPSSKTTTQLLQRAHLGCAYPTGAVTSTNMGLSPGSIFSTFQSYCHFCPHSTLISSNWLGYFLHFSEV